MTRDLEIDVASWDAKSAAAIERIYARHADDPELVAQLIALLDHEPLQRGATWLLKHHLEQDEGRVLAKDARRLYARLARLVHWESRLHVLQCLPTLPMPAAARPKLEAFVRAGLEDERKFVRAWAYGALHALATAFPDLRPEATLRLERAVEEESASVRARIRQVLGQRL